MFTSIKFYATSAFINFITNLFFGFFVLSKNRKLAVNRHCAYFCFAAGAWSFFYFVWLSTTNEALANFFVRTCMMGAIFIAPCYLHFSVLLTKIKLPSLFYKIDYLLGCLLGSLVYTRFFGGRPEQFMIFPYWPRAAILLYFVTVYFTCNVIVAWVLLAREYLNSDDKIIRSRIFLLAVGTIFGFLGGSVNFLPWYRVPILPVTTVFSSFWTMFSIYAIVRYRFLEIDTVIHRTILWLTAVLLLVLPWGIIGIILKKLVLATNTYLLLLIIYLLIFITYYSRLRPRIDHIFRRRKYDYYQVLSEIGERIGTELDINNVITRLFKELKEVLYIRNGLILIQQLGQEDYTEVGSSGYDKLLDIHKEEKVSLRSQDPLGQWLQTHQTALEREQIEIDPQYEPIKREALTLLTQNMIEVLIPIVMGDKVSGLLGIGKKENLQPYTTKDIELLEKMGKQLGVTIDNALHHEDIVEKERLDEELKLGREIQMNLLPHQIPQIPHLSLQGMMTPAKEIGGDYYDFITLPNKEELAIVIGDVSGKGVAAGLLMSMVKATIHAYSQEEASPRHILLRTNAFLHQHIGGQKFMTLLYLKWQSQSRTLTYSSAGHEHILICRCQSQQIEAIQSGGFMLGMVPDIEKFLEQREIELNPGDKILLYTDGVTEAENASGGRFGLERLKESFQRHSQKPPNELMQAVKDETYAFIGAHPQYDDITLVVMEAV